MKAFRIITVILLAGWMAAIFILSAETAAESSATSGGVITALAKIFYPGFEHLDEAGRLQLVESLQFITRKAAHFSCYGVLGLLSFLSVATYRKTEYSFRVALSMLISLLYAVCDEIHQLYVPGRSCELRDVCIDFSGSLLAITFAALVARLSKKIYGKIKYEKGAAAVNKKELFELNNDLRARIAAEENKSVMLKAEISRKDSRIAELNAEIERLNARLNATPPLKVLEAKLTRQASVPKEMDYGAEVIGKVVVEAAKCCNRLTSGEPSQAVKELVNLILGKTEVTKADILKIVSSDTSPEAKMQEIDRCFTEAADYFESVMAQQG